MGFKRSTPRRAGLPAVRPVVLSVVLAVGVLMILAGCRSGSAALPAPTGTTTSTSPTTTASAPVTPSPSPTPTPTPDTNGATAAPSWLYTRVLPIGPDGFGISKGTPKELRNRRIITVDVLPPPTDISFHSKIQTVPASVLKRSSWTSACPVSASQLRYVTVSFAGFDGRAHTGELLVNRSVAKDIVTVFHHLYDARWPIEEMRITTKAELSAPPTGDGNDTSAFACRPVRGQRSWSQHAYGLAVDVDPFHNPSVQGRTVLPELAKAYVDRHRGLPGMITPGSVPVLAFRSVGWGWGGNFSSKKDWMHFSSTGG